MWFFLHVSGCPGKTIFRCRGGTGAAVMEGQVWRCAAGKQAKVIATAVDIEPRAGAAPTAGVRDGPAPTTGMLRTDHENSRKAETRARAAHRLVDFPHVLGNSMSRRSDSWVTMIHCRIAEIAGTRRPNRANLGR